MPFISFSLYRQRLPSLPSGPFPSLLPSLSERGNPHRFTDFLAPKGTLQSTIDRDEPERGAILQPHLQDHHVSALLAPDLLALLLYQVRTTWLLALALFLSLQYFAGPALAPSKSR